MLIFQLILFCLLFIGLVKFGVWDGASVTMKSLPNVRFEFKQGWR